MKRNPNHQRKPWDDYFLDIAKLTAGRSTCDRLNVGAVIVKDNRILTTGYNGSLPQAPHCSDVGHLIVNNHCERTIHAEVNAITQAAKTGIPIDGSSIYITHSPCLNCFKVIAVSGITKIIFNEYYKLDAKMLQAYRLVGGYTEVDKELYFRWNIDIGTKRWIRI